jgi:RNA polymerase-associated protein RTF1
MIPPHTHTHTLFESIKITNLVFPSLNISSKKKSTQPMSKTSAPWENDDDDDINKEVLALIPNKKRKIMEERSESGSENEEYREEDFDDGYDSNFYGDEEDRAILDSLPELKREEIISERREKREQLMRKRERAIREGKLKPKATTSSAAGDDKKKKSLRRKTNEKQTVKEDRSAMNKKSAIADIGARRKANKDKKKKSEDEDYKSELAYDEEEDMKPVKSQGKVSKKETSSQMDEDYYEPPDIKLQDLERILIKRSMLDKWLDEPYFEKVVKDCFVRVSLGDNKQGQRTYRLAEVHSFVKHKPYQFGDKMIDKYLVLKHGISKRKFPMALISNQPNISSSEFEKWKKEMIDCHEPFPTLDFIKEKEKEILDTKNYKYTEEDIAKRAKIMNANIYHFERERLKALIEGANDETERQEYQEQLDKLNANWKRQQININSLTNVQLAKPEERIISAKPKKVIRRSDIDSTAKSTPPRPQTFDPFTRRRTRPANPFSSDPSPEAAKQSPSSSNIKKEQEIQLQLKSPGTSLTEAHKFVDINIDMGQLEDSK